MQRVHGYWWQELAARVGLLQAGGGTFWPQLLDPGIRRLPACLEPGVLLGCRLYSV